MKPYDLVIMAAAAAFFLASGDAANDSERINVELPSQYQLIWDQSPGVAETRPASTMNVRPLPFARQDDRANPDGTWAGRTLGLGSRVVIRPPLRARG